MKSPPSHRPIRRWLLVACLPLTWLGLRAAPAAACSPPPNPWFNEHVTLDTQGLPPELSVTNPDGKGNIKITAPWEPVLYILLPNGNKERVLTQLTTDQHTGKQQQLRMTSIDASSFEWYLKSYVNRQRYDDNRPADVAIPAAQHVTLTLRYGAETFRVPITLSYSLNQDYVPDMRATFDCEIITAREQTAIAANWISSPIQNDQVHGAPPSLGERAEALTLLLLGLGLWVTAGTLAWRWRRAGAGRS